MMGVSSFVGASESPSVELDRDRRGRDWMGRACMGDGPAGGGGGGALTL